MKQIEASILGQTYVLACPEGGEATLREAVAIVDREMGAIRDAGKVRARERIAVLTALNLAFQQVEGARGATAARASAAPDDGDPQRLAGLIERLDAALAKDGRLL